MARVATKDVFDGYFKTLSEERAIKTRNQVDRPEVYAYEKQLGKSIFDMDADEIIEMLKSFNKSRVYGKPFDLSENSVTQIISIYRDIWEFYSDNYEEKRNPWYNPRLKGSKLLDEMSKVTENFSYKDIGDAIKGIQKNYPVDSYDTKYLECLVRLFYEGFAEAQEIVMLKETDINFITREVLLKGRTIQLSDRCLKLLNYVHNLCELDCDRCSYVALPYQDGYFKFIVKKCDADKFNRRTAEECARMLTRKISSQVSNVSNKKMSYRRIYLCGFYDYMVSKTSQERTKELLSSVRNSEDAQELMRYAKEYGIAANNVSYVKKILRPFL